MDIRGKTAIVTGAGRGIGKAVALALGREGMNVVAASRTLKEVERTARELIELGVKSVAVRADISVMEDIDRLADTAMETFGGIDVLVNNAGVLMADGIENLNQRDWDLTMAVNVRGTAFLSRAVMERMKQNDESYVVNICSTAALGAKPEVTSYSVSKYGVTGLTEALYKYGKAHNIRVSAVFPGVTDTEMLQSADMPCTPDMLMKPEDIAYCVLFLLKSPRRMVVKEIVPWATR
ncbi:MAG TPA: SDR family oxidoreductase, partial [Feifaniaceae bacterium]|nr:SDR family oxidoreductase [Feifaniaceae bacterium]